MAIIVRNKTSVYGLVTDLANLVAADAAELNRATGVEGILANLTTAVKTDIVSAINAEVERAGLAEAAASTAASDEAARALLAEGVLATAIADEEARALAAESVLQDNIDTVTSTVNALGNAFNYVGAVTGGDAPSMVMDVLVSNAFDLATLDAAGKDAGDYYKVTTAGYFKVGEGAEFYANINDGLVWNTLGGVDKIDNTDSTSAGTTDFITVNGSADTGYTIDVAATFKTRVTTAESDIDTLETSVGTLASLSTTDKSSLVAALNEEIADRALDEAALTTALQSYADAAATSGGGIPLLESKVVTNDRIVLTNAPKAGVSGILNFGTVRYIDGNGIAYDAPVTLDATDETNKTLIISVDASGQWNTFSVQVQYLYVAA